MSLFDRATLAGAMTLALVPSVTLGAEAVTPGVAITIDGETFSVAAAFDGRKFYNIEDYRFGPGGANMLNAQMDPDPSIIAALGIVDFDAPSTFDFSFVLPIVPTTGPVNLKLTLGGSCTDFPITGGCSATPIYASGTLAEGSLDGVSLVFGGTAFSGPAGGSGAFATTVFNAYLPAATTYNVLDMHLGFLGSGSGDAFSYTLSVEVTPAAIPEPQTYAMLLAGLGLLGFAVQRRKLHKN